ncbi:MAG: helix-turn-helix domain-containing protein, partial [Gammaproteobacteria bacterium]|nr:helix-turn-helix domain-containing protein [Gammaproteobacteria bacterium]
MGRAPPRAVPPAPFVSPTPGFVPIEEGLSMPQMQLPLFPDGVTHITSELAFEKRDGKVTYVNGHMPIFVHDENDTRTFRMITAQFCVNGNTKQMDIVRAFGITAISVKRAVDRYRKKGTAGFFTEPRRRGPVVLTESVLTEAQRFLDEGRSVTRIAEELELKRDTLAKAVSSGRLHKPVKKEVPEGSSKSERSANDAKAPMGMGTTNELARVAASLGKLEAVDPVFQSAMDIPNGGVLLAIPALLAVGLLRHAGRYFQIPKGYYPLESIFLLLAFMALTRIKAIEDLRYYAPGEWGKLLGLDRIPEVRTLRAKLALLTDEDQASRWSAELCAEWMGAEPDNASVFYVDGHVRVYYGNQTKLPRHYVARQRLCLRATTDYWVNALDGQPFFLVNQAVDPGLIKVLENEIVPRLEREVPNQPTIDELEADPLAHRFTLVFDREGYSPAFFLKMWEKRIACLTYHKFPGEDWPEEEFTLQRVRLALGGQVEMELAERRVLLGKKLWAREIRKLTERGHQTSVLSTDERSDMGPVAAAMFARWSQENFFRYMRQHYNLDRLLDYSTEDIPDTTPVVNPAYRQLDGQVRSKVAMLTRKKAAFGAMNLKGEIEPKKVEGFEREKAALQEQSMELEKEVRALKAQRKATPKHITIGELPEEKRFDRLSTQSKHFIDTIKMTA